MTMPRLRTRNISTFGLIMRHELRVMIADRTLPLICMLFAILLLYGFITGLQETRQRESVAGALATAQAQTNTANIASWRMVMSRQEKPDPFANPVDPSAIGGGLGAQYAILPTLALSPVAAGQSDMLADYFKVTYESRTAFMQESEIESPWKLLSGQFDLAFVLVYIFPLFVFAISFNMLSVERDQGTLRMLLSQPLTLPRLVMAKMFARASVLTSVAVLVPAVALLFARADRIDGGMLAALALWMALVIGYGLFWFSLSALVNSFGRSSAANALLLIGSWVLLVLVVPVGLNLAVSRAAPAPSRTDLATQTRLVTIDGLNRYKHLFGSDYTYVSKPDSLLPKNGRLEVAPRLRGFYMMDAFVDRQLTALLNRFDRQLRRQQALVDRFSFLSPAIIANEGMASLAGNGTRRYDRFNRQVIRYHERWKAFFVPRVLNGIAIVESDFHSFPRWSWQEESRVMVQADALGKIAHLLAIGILMVLIAAWRFRRRPLV